MKQFYFLLAVCVGVTTSLFAQNTVTVDASATQLGYANVFETPANGGAFVFGDSWGVPDLKTVVDAGANTLTLQPNFNTYDAADPFWVDQTTLLGNKLFEGNTFVEDPSLVGSALTFEGNVSAFTIDAAYEVVAFIKVFNGDFSVLKEENMILTGVGNFSVVYTNVEAADATVQYGFKVTGINANPVDEAALGSVVVTASSLGVNDNNSITVAVYPNPATDSFTIDSIDEISSVRIYNVLGQEVLNVAPNNTSATIDISALRSGIYLTQVSTNAGSKTTKLIKK